MRAYQQLESILNKQFQLQHCQAIVSWDEAVMMPRGGGTARANALTTLEGVIHEQRTQPRIQDLIEEAKTDTTLNHWQKTNLQLIETRYINATLIPLDLMQAHTNAAIISQQQWRELREKNDWKTFLPYLKETFNLSKEIAEKKAHHWNISAYDAQLDYFNPGFNQANIDPLFAKLESTLPTLIKTIAEHQQSSRTCQGPFDPKQQHKLNLAAMKLLQFDFNHGRLDTTHHPFCGGTPDDVRITTRYNEDDFLSSLMAVCHETGHGRYEQGLPKKWLSQPVGEALGMAVHESQSLLIEMQICRSREFFQALLPDIKACFGDQPDLNINNLYQICTTVSPSFIRVDADEVSYPLHVILRYKIEQQLMQNTLHITDLPDAWNSMMQKYFNLSTKGNDKDGVMQDVHWPSGAFGYFPAYTLGRLIAAQLFETLEQQHPDIMQGIAQGEMSHLFNWLHTRIYSKGQSEDIDALLMQATNQTLSADGFIRHIHRRYLNN